MSDAGAAHATAASKLGPDVLDRLDGDGFAVIPRLLAPGACADLAALYADDTHFRSRVVMARHGFGRGEYKYFA